MNLLRRTAKQILAKIPAMQHRQSFALNNLDKKLEPFVGKKNGFFIEAGANDGLKQTNTFYFEKYFGWSGLLIEPIPKLFEECQKNRPNCRSINAALVSKTNVNSTIKMTYCGLMSSAEGAFDSEEQRKEHTINGKKFLKNSEHSYEVSVPARTLTSIIDELKIPQIDLLSLDVEGFELEALGGLEFSRTCPKFLLVEVRHNLRKEIDEHLSPLYRPECILTMLPKHSDILYVHT